MPIDFSRIKLKRGEIAFRSCSEGILALKWQDQKGGEDAVNNAHCSDGGYLEKA